MIDKHDLDALARRFAQPVSRRAGIAALLGGLLGLGALADDADATNKAKRRRKRRQPPTAVRCNTSADCPIKGQDCLLGACTCLLDMKPVSPCGDVCCKDGERCFFGNGRYWCKTACRLPLRSGGDYTFCDFSGQNISGEVSDVSLAYANLNGARVTASLRKVDFTYADLSNATLTPSVMDDVTFQNAQLDRASIRPGAIIGPVSFYKAKLTRFTWIEPTDPPVRPTGTVEISFNETTTPKSAVEDIDDRTIFFLANDDLGTYNHSFRRARIVRADFRKSNMLDVTFERASWEVLDLRGCVNTERLEDEWEAEGTGRGWSIGWSVTWPDGRKENWWD